MWSNGGGAGLCRLPRAPEVGRPPNSNLVWIVSREWGAKTPLATPGVAGGRRQVPQVSASKQRWWQLSPVQRKGPADPVVSKVGTPASGSLPRVGSWCVCVCRAGRESPTAADSGGNSRRRSGDSECGQRNWRGTWDQQKGVKQHLEQCKCSANGCR